MTRRRLLRFGVQSGWEAAIVIPARNEAARIEGCLDALATSLARTARPGGVVLVVNNSDDATAARAAQWWRGRPDIPGMLIDCAIPAHRACVGRARGIGLHAAMPLLATSGALMTSDADCRAAPGWVADNLAALERADLVCGTVVPDPSEIEALRPALARHGAGEGLYMQESIRLASYLDPLPHDPDPRHRNAAGASLAFRPALYRDIGGMPALRIGEDRAFVAQAEARDWRVRYADAPVVTASCRLTGRTGGGMAAALRARRDEPDPLCDEWLEPAATAILRAGLRGALRAAWPDPARLIAAFNGWDISPVPPDGDRFGVWWRAIESAEPRLARRRLRQSDLPNELQHMLDYLSRQQPERRAV